MVPVDALLFPPATSAERFEGPRYLARFLLIIIHTTGIILFPFHKAYNITDTLL